MYLPFFDNPNGEYDCYTIEIRITHTVWVVYKYSYDIILDKYWYVVIFFFGLQFFAMCLVYWVFYIRIATIDEDMNYERLADRFRYYYYVTFLRIINWTFLICLILDVILLYLFWSNWPIAASVHSIFSKVLWEPSLYKYWLYIFIGLYQSLSFVFLFKKKFYYSSIFLVCLEYILIDCIVYLLYTYFYIFFVKTIVCIIFVTFAALLHRSWGHHWHELDYMDLWYLKEDAEGHVSRYENEICMRIRTRRVAVILEYLNQLRDKWLKAIILKDKNRRENYIKRKNEGKLTLLDRLIFILWFPIDKRLDWIKAECVDKKEEIIKKKQEEFDNLIINDKSYRYTIIKKIIDESMEYIYQEGVDDQLLKEDLLVRRLQHEWSLFIKNHNPFKKYFKTKEEFEKELTYLITYSIQIREIYKVRDGIPLTLQELINYHNARHKDPYFFVLNRRQFNDPHELTYYDDVEYEELIKNYPMLINPLKNENITSLRFYLRKLHKMNIEKTNYHKEISTLTHNIVMNTTYLSHQASIINHPFQLSVSSENYEPMLDVADYTNKVENPDYDPETDDNYETDFEDFDDYINFESDLKDDDDDDDRNENLEHIEELSQNNIINDISNNIKYDDNLYEYKSDQEWENIENDEKIYLKQFISFNNTNHNDFYKNYNWLKIVGESYAYSGSDSDLDAESFSETDNIFSMMRKNTNYYYQTLRLLSDYYHENLNFCDLALDYSRLFGYNNDLLDIYNINNNIINNKYLNSKKQQVFFGQEDFYDVIKYEYINEFMPLFVYNDSLTGKLLKKYNQNNNFVSFLDNFFSKFNNIQQNNYINIFMDEIDYQDLTDEYDINLHLLYQNNNNNNDQIKQLSFINLEHILNLQDDDDDIEDFFSFKETGEYGEIFQDVVLKTMDHSFYSIVCEEEVLPIFYCSQFDDNDYSEGFNNNPAVGTEFEDTIVWFDESTYSWIRAEDQEYYEHYEEKKSFYIKLLANLTGLSKKQYSNDIDYDIIDSDSKYIQNLIAKLALNEIIFTQKEKQAFYNVMFDKFNEFMYVYDNIILSSENEYEQLLNNYEIEKHPVKIKQHKISQNINDEESIEVDEKEEPDELIRNKIRYANLLKRWEKETKLQQEAELNKVLWDEEPIINYDLKPKEKKIDEIDENIIKSDDIKITKEIIIDKILQNIRESNKFWGTGFWSSLAIPEHEFNKWNLDDFNYEQIKNWAVDEIKQVIKYRNKFVREREMEKDKLTDIKWIGYDEFALDSQKENENIDINEFKKHLETEIIFYIATKMRNFTLVTRKYIYLPQNYIQMKMEETRKVFIITHELLVKRNKSNEVAVLKNLLSKDKARLLEEENQITIKTVINWDKKYHLRHRWYDQYNWKPRQWIIWDDYYKELHTRCFYLQDIAFYDRLLIDQLSFEEKNLFIINKFTNNVSLKQIYLYENFFNDYYDDVITTKNTFETVFLPFVEFKTSVFYTSFNLFKTCIFNFPRKYFYDTVEGNIPHTFSNYIYDTSFDKTWYYIDPTKIDYGICPIRRKRKKRYTIIEKINYFEDSEITTETFALWKEYENRQNFWRWGNSRKFLYVFDAYLMPFYAFIYMNVANCNICWKWHRLWFEPKIFGYFIHIDKTGLHTSREQNMQNLRNQRLIDYLAAKDPEERQKNFEAFEQAKEKLDILAEDKEWIATRGISRTGFDLEFEEQQRIFYEDEDRIKAERAQEVKRKYRKYYNEICDLSDQSELVNDQLLNQTDNVSNILLDFDWINLL